MPQEKIDELTKHFAAMGAPDPGSWARSQVEEGKPQWARFVFLRQLWSYVVADDDPSWIHNMAAMIPRRPNDPGESIGPALRRLLAAGARPEDINEVVRVMQWELMGSFCYLLADPSIVDYRSSDMPRVNWELMQTDEEDKPIARISGLHESVLSLDPSGREMRPKTDPTT